MIKLHQYLNKQRNSKNKIINKQNFKDLNIFLNEKIKESLFDINIISNSIKNEKSDNFKDTFLLEKELNEIIIIMGQIENKNINKNINGVKENIKVNILNFEKDINNNFFEIDNKKSNPCIDIINSSTNNNNSIISSINN